MLRRCKRSRKGAMMRETRRNKRWTKERKKRKESG